MTRVAITGVGALTPLGLDAPSTWRAALAGESGIGWISTFDTDGLPVRVAGEVKGFDPTQVVSPKEARKLERNVLLGVAAVKQDHCPAPVFQLLGPDFEVAILGDAFPFAPQWILIDRDHLFVGENVANLRRHIAQVVASYQRRCHERP